MVLQFDNNENNVPTTVSSNVTNPIPSLNPLFQGLSYQIVCYSPSGMRPVSVLPKYNKICQAIVNNNEKEVCKEALSLESASSVCVEQTRKLVEEECRGLCSTSNTTMLKKKTVQDILNFSFEAFMEEEIKVRASTLYDIVLTVINARGVDRNVLKNKQRKISAAGMATSVLLKTRNQNMSAGQLYLSAILIKAGVTRMVIHDISAFIEIIIEKPSINTINYY